MNWNSSVDKWDDKESSLCKLGFNDGCKVGGNAFEVKNIESIKVLYLLFRDFGKSGSGFLFFCWVVESCIIVEGALLEARWTSISSFREAFEPCKDFLTSVKGVVFWGKSEGELYGEIGFL